MSMLDKQTPSTLIQGINKDLTFQNPNQVTFALNTIRNSHDGGKYEYQSEPGNELVESLPTGYQLMGSIYGINNEVYLIAVSPPVGTLIGIFKEGKFTKVVDLVDLGNSIDHPITGEFRIRNGCERVIYWCDGYSTDKWFNFDNVELFKDGSNWDANKFNFNPSRTIPKIDLYSVNDYGGQLALGSYYFQIEALDKNQNVLYKTDITPQTVIYDESQNDNFFNIDGGLNYPQYDTAVGGLPITNKSITLRFYNIDPLFAYFRVNVARQLAGTQVIDAHSVGRLIPLNGKEFNWTYVGYNVNDGDYPIDYTSVFSNNELYQSAYVMEQVQNRLVRANLKKSVRDYSGYQEKASLITAKWVSEVCDLENAKDNTTIAVLAKSGSPKNPRTYWEMRNSQGDEIYAYSVQYLHNNAEWSPCFPLIGRNAISTDLEELTVVSNASVLGATDVWESEVQHISESEFTFWNGDFIGSTIPRWKVFNTATDEGTTGQFGFYECDSTYPELVDCDGNSLWGVDADGFDITSDTKIRLFRFPDRKIKEHFLKADVDGKYTTLGYVFGVQFDNIEYPSSDIIGHRFCYAKRDEFNKTVLDSGWVAKPQITGDDVTLNWFFNSYDEDTVYARYNSTQVLYNKAIFNADYLKINQAYRFNSEEIAESDFSEYDVVNNSVNTTMKVYNYHLDYYSISTVDRENRKIENSIFNETNSYTNNSEFPVIIDGSSVTLNSFTPDSVLELNYKLDDLIPIFGDYSFGVQESVPECVYKINCFYGYKKKNNKPFENILDISYSYLNHNYTDSVDTADNIFFGGDTLLVSSSPFRAAFPSVGGGFGCEGVSYYQFWEEQQINASLRHAGLENQYLYYRVNHDDKYILSKISILNEDERYVIQPSDNWLDEYYKYNMDFNVQSNQQYKTTLPFNYNYCSSCSGIYTNRIIFSPKSFDEELFDLYRINLTNDYIDIPGHRGPIRGLKYKNGQLLVHCEDGTFILRPNPQALVTDVSSVYLSTGDFLSIPPVELIQTDIGFAGCQSKQHQCDTPFGWCWIDQRRGEIFKFNNDLENISKIGLEQWFKENLPSETKNLVYQTYELDYPNKSTTGEFGYGIIMYYDPRFKRLLISKKDFLPINLQTTSSTDGLYYDTNSNTWEYTSGNGTINSPVDYGYVLYFENKSWTLSFGFEENQWWSWHSYRPITAFSDEMNYYTTSVEDYNANKIWRHKSKENYQKYYNTKYDMIVEWMIFDLETDNYYGLNYTGYSLQWDSTNKQWKTVDATFNKGVFYNFDQSSGLVNLTLQNQHINPYQNVTLPKTTKYIIKTDQNYKISGIYDIATASPVMTSDWNLLSIYNSYIDVVPNTNNLNSTTSNYYTGNIWDKFVFNRLYYKPSQDYKKVLILSATKEHKSIR